MHQMLTTDERLAAQIAFLLEIDRLKGVLRRTLVSDGDRRENSGEHSWHMAVAALVLAEYASEPVDLARVVKMALLHDIVEIDAGDTFYYDAAGALDKAEREVRAAERIFGLLPPEQAADLRGAWEEFERRQTPEARFAAALDRFMPVLLNVVNEGLPWRQHGVQGEQVLAMTAAIEPGAPAIAAYARQLIADAMDRGYFDPAGETH